MKVKICLLSIFVLFVCNSVLAESFRLTTGNDFKPFTDESLPNGGIYTEMVKFIFKEMGYETEFEFLPWKRGYMVTEMGEFIATFPYNKNEKRAKVFMFSKPLISYKEHFFVKKDSSFQFTSFGALNNVTYCLPLGHNSADIQKALDDGRVTVERPPNYSNCFKMIKAGRADFISINPFVGWDTISNLFGHKSDFRSIPIEDMPVSSLHMMFSKNHPKGKKILKQFDQKLGELEKQGVIQEKFKQYLQGDSL